MKPNHQAMHKGLMKILEDGTFPLKIREVAAFHTIYQWAKNDLPILFEHKKEEPPKPVPKKTTKKKVKA